MATLKEKRDELAVMVGGLFVGGAVVAFTAGPVLRYTDPTMLMNGGLVLFGGISFLYAATVLSDIGHRSRNRTIFEFSTGVIFLISGGLKISNAVSDAKLAASANDRRCLAVQQDMLSARPRRTDGPDLFQALGCRPQGEGNVYAPASQRRVNR